MNLLKTHAENELNIIGLTESEDEMNSSMRKHILHMVDEFSKEEHSGFSARYAISCLEKILKFEPLSPLTGDNSEWIEVSNGLYQNIRCCRVFKENGVARDNEGLVFYNIVVGDNGEQHKEYFTNSDSRVEITFPYVPKREYKEIDNEN